MFFKLVSRNSSRSRKENGLFFSSLIVSVVAFYIILALSEQDVMVFLKKMESDAVDRLMDMIPVFYTMALVILFFLIYYASRFQLERRRHEFGVYLMLGMRRMKLFGMLLAEDIRSSIVTLAVGLPAAVLLSECISLVTARMVGIGIVGHQVSFSWKAVLWTAAGFLWIKLAAFLILSGRISRQEIGSLLAETPEGAKKQLPAPVYASAMAVGICLLLVAYRNALREETWRNVGQFGLAMFFGLAGTFLLFWGMRFLMALLLKSRKKDRPLHLFNIRQIQETVIHRSGTMAVCSLLILAALCCFGAGTAIARFYDDSGAHVLDYTFRDDGTENAASRYRKMLQEKHLDQQFSQLFEMKTGYVSTTDTTADRSTFQMDAVIAGLQDMEPSRDRDILLANLSMKDYPYLISLSGYNCLLTAAGLPVLELDEGEAAVYMDSTTTTLERTRIMDCVLESEPETLLAGETCRLIGNVQTTNLVTDRSITLMFALIVPDSVFESLTQGKYTVYLNGILAKNKDTQVSLLTAISEMNKKLNEAGLAYESYLQNMGRRLFYMVAASYITIYLAIIFLIIANTVIGVQFLMGQQKSHRRYRTLVHLGAGYETLCRSAQKQIRWYFGLPAAVAVCSSLFGVRALFAGLLPAGARSSTAEMMIASAAMIFALCVVEYFYMRAVRRSSDRYLLTLMVPEREE